MESAANLYSTQQADEPTDFIIQNITLNYHFVSDILLSFAPREVKDLTWDDPTKVRQSRDLRNSIRSGILKKLEKDEYEKTMALQYEKEKKDLLRDQKNKANYKKFKDESNDKEFMADTFELDKARKKPEELDITGTANHPMSYVAAYEIAGQMAEQRGDTLTAEEFAQIVESNPNVVPQLLSQTKVASAQAHKVFYAVPPSEGSQRTAVVETKMTNYNKNLLYGDDSDNINTKAAYIKDALDVDTGYDFSDDDQDFAEEVNLEDDTD